VPVTNNKGIQFRTPEENRANLEKLRVQKNVALNSRPSGRAIAREPITGANTSRAAMVAISGAAAAPGQSLGENYREQIDVDGRRRFGLGRCEQLEPGWQPLRAS
jgi:hypothetical protein